YVSAMHQLVSISNPSSAQLSLQLSDAILTSSVISAGTAGGPMLNVGGQVIGIAMQSQPSTQTNGFGLNVADVQDDVQQILQNGQVVVPSLGVTSTDLSPELASLSGLPMGSQLVSVDKGGPAASAGLQPGDVITQLDDVQLDAAHPLRLLLRSRFPPNQKVTVTYSRSGAWSQAQLTLTAEHPACS